MHNPILKNIIGEKPLSERELEVGNFLAAGLSDNEIASKLSITPDTVKFHLKNIYIVFE
jgi:LuxR family maltose regulon positive regulatory protein